MNTKNKVNKAFRLLRKAGYIAKQNFLCCQSCGWYAIDTDYPDNNGRVVFYHNQDNDSWRGKELITPLYLAWSGNAEEICEILKSVGLLVDHNGSENSRIAILPAEL